MIAALITVSISATFSRARFCAVGGLEAINGNPPLQGTHHHHHHHHQPCHVRRGACQSGYVFQHCFQGL
jgi:hypothetical protein